MHKLSPGNESCNASYGGVISVAECLPYYYDVKQFRPHPITISVTNLSVSAYISCKRNCQLTPKIGEKYFKTLENA
jgi:hypothetical protein